MSVPHQCLSDKRLQYPVSLVNKLQECLLTRKANNYEPKTVPYVLYPLILTKIE